MSSKNNIARIIYPLRSIGSILAIINLFLHHYFTRGAIAPHIWMLCVVAIIYPHLAYYRAMDAKQGYNKSENQNLLVDQLMYTCIAYGFDLNFIGVFLFYLSSSTVLYAVGGIQLFIKGWLVALVSFFVLYFVFPFDINVVPNYFAFIPSFIFISLTMHALARQTYLRKFILKQVKREINAKKEYFDEQKNDLLKLNQEIIYQRDQIKKRHNLIKEDNNEVNSSIEYSQRIQRATFTTFDKYMFDDQLLIYQPKDMISGDFYKSFQYQGVTVLLVADCTGHGVPGALMSMIGSVLLDQIIKVNKVTNPAHILYYLNDRILSTLQPEENNLRDGMVISICTIEGYMVGEKPQGKVTFAGASSPLVYIQNGEIHQIKGDKFMIGGFNYSNKKKSFTAHTIEINGPTSLYMYSDGFQDQFGGRNKRKFGSRRLKELLLENYLKPMKQQEHILQTTMNDWISVSDEIQIDDITLLGVQLGKIR